MIKELRCQNYKAFGEETQFPLSDLTVLVGPNNAGKSTVLDLVRLTQDGHSLNLTSGSGRLRTFDTLLNDKGSGSLQVGKRVLAKVTLRPAGPAEGLPPPTLHLADELSFKSKFVSLGTGFLLKRRDVFLHPRGKGVGIKQRVFSQEFDVGSAEKVDVESGRPAQDLLDYLHDNLPEEETEGGKKEDPNLVPNDLLFGIPWKGQTDSVRRESPARESPGPESKPLFDLSPTGPYRRQISKNYYFDESLVELAFDILDAIRHQTSGESPLDLSVGALEYSENETVHVGSEEEPPDIKSYPAHWVVDELLNHVTLPQWIPPDKEEALRVVRHEILAPLIEKMNNSFSRLNPGYLPSFRARPDRYYGPQDSLTPLLEDYQEAHPTVQEDVEEWLDVFGLGSDLKIEAVAPDLYAASIRRNGERRYLADLGSGTAQLLPLILKLTVESPSSILLLEEPEANLHPNLQSQLADLLVELIDSGHQVLVETHSEYLVRRLQYLVARGKCDSDSTSVLYVDGVEEEETKTPNVRKISIDEHGQLSEPFGSGFFDEATDLMVDLFKYGSEN